MLNTNKQTNQTAARGVFRVAMASTPDSLLRLWFPFFLCVFTRSSGSNVGGSVSPQLDSPGAAASCGKCVSNER